MNVVGGPPLSQQAIVSAEELIGILRRAAAAIARTVDAAGDLGTPGGRPGQYAIDLRAEAAGVAVLLDEGCSVMSEESGWFPNPGAPVVVLDPVDGSRNAARGVPFFATSLCAIDEQGPLVAVVADLPRRVRYEAVRDRGAWMVTGDVRREIKASSCRALADAFVLVSGQDPPPLRAAARRSLGSMALELCLTASGTFDGYIDTDDDKHAPWDYLGGLLVCTEAGAVAADGASRPLFDVGMAVRRSPVVAGTAELLALLRAATASSRRTL